MFFTKQYVNVGYCWQYFIYFHSILLLRGIRKINFPMNKIFIYTGIFMPEYLFEVHNFCVIICSNTADDINLIRSNEAKCIIITSGIGKTGFTW